MDRYSAPATAYGETKANNFDLLRFIFAFMVCLVHIAQLSARPELGWLGNFLSSKFAVNAFFVISGFLIFMSYERSASLGLYAQKRLRRIYPAYITVIFICALLLFFVSTEKWPDYFSVTWLKYIVFNGIFLNFAQPELPGVFNGNPHHAVNGALWTLKIEVMFYMAVPILVWLMRRLGHLKTIGAVYILSFVYYAFFTHLAAATGKAYFIEIARQLPGQLMYFLSGTVLYYYFSFFQRRRFLYIAIAILVLIGNIYLPLSFLAPLAIGILVIFLATARYLGRFGKYGDFSYGIYILHFPVIQIFIQNGAFSANSYFAASAVIVTTLLLAFLLWHGIEKHFLSKAFPYTKQNEPDIL